MKRWVLFFGLIGFFLLNLSVVAEPPSNFILTWVINEHPMEKDVPPLIQRYYILNNIKMRVDKVMKNHTLISTIYRKDLNLIWNLNPPEENYTEIPFNQKIWDYEIVDLSQAFINRSRRTGQTKYQGFVCDIYKNKTGENEEKGLVSKDFKIVLKYYAKKGGKLVFQMETSEIRRVKPDSSLFELPKNYRIAIIKHTDIKAWIGQKVIFLPKESKYQTEGYPDYSFDFKNTIPYKDFVGKKAIIEKMEPSRTTDAYFVTLKTEDNQTIHTYAEKGFLHDVCFESELVNAQQQYKNKYIWFKPILGWNKFWGYDEQEKSHDYKAKILEKFLVLNVDCGYQVYGPIRFTLQRESGELVYYYGSYSRQYDPWNRFQPLSEFWYLSDPKTLHPDWSQETWTLIENYQLVIGMNKDMVIMCKGKPNEIKKHSTKKGIQEEWIYGGLGIIVYFENDLVIKIEE